MRVPCHGQRYFRNKLKKLETRKMHMKSSSTAEEEVKGEEKGGAEGGIKV